MPNTSDSPSLINVLTPTCPSRMTLKIIADKWALLVVFALKHESRRNGELLRLISDVTQKMLTQTLRKLEQSGIVERIIYHEVPPKVEYRLTALGRSLLVPINAISEWAETHYAEVIAAQQRHAYRDDPTTDLADLADLPTNDAR
ncbi:MAG TPA: helix-turn-helix domain-containing protein [Aggregatilineales bacterium]|nr:helix-turn-helix transcriptional regulator [Anaerolineales bacterium]HRE46353.1 helix-turn-helix domain-containing protein [Aggregatilineales bacterium]